MPHTEVLHDKGRASGGSGHKGLKSETATFLRVSREGGKFTRQKWAMTRPQAAVRLPCMKSGRVNSWRHLSALT